MSEKGIMMSGEEGKNAILKLVQQQQRSSQEPSEEVEVEDEEEEEKWDAESIICK
jgi:hypothetical protein